VRIVIFGSLVVWSLAFGERVVGWSLFFYNPPFLPLLLLEQEKKNQQTHIRSKHGSRNLTAIGAMADVGVDETIAFDGLLFPGRKNCQLICSFSVWILKE